MRLNSAVSSFCWVSNFVIFWKQLYGAFQCNAEFSLPLSRLSNLLWESFRLILANRRLRLQRNYRNFVFLFRYCYLLSDGSTPKNLRSIHVSHSFWTGVPDLWSGPRLCTSCPAFAVSKFFDSSCRHFWTGSYGVCWSPVHFRLIVYFRENRRFCTKYPYSAFFIPNGSNHIENFSPFLQHRICENKLENCEQDQNSVR